MCRTELPDDFYGRIRSRLYQRIGRELALAYRVLDLGCGNCDLVRFLRQTYRQRVTGVDISDGSMPRRDDPSSSHAPLRCIKANASRLDFLRDASVDALVTTWALHEMTGPEKVLREAFRVLRPGGKMLIVDFSKDSLAQRLWDEKYWTAPQVGTLLKKTGFAGVRARTIHQEQVIWALGSKPPRTEGKT